MCLAVVVLAGLVSAVTCQVHMAMDTTSAPHHATHEHRGPTPSESPSEDFVHGNHSKQSNDGGTPAEPCCILQVADARTPNPMVLMPDAVEMTVDRAVTETAPQLLNASEASTHKPPGRCSLLHQTCVLLI
jgi:hypothetical protein